MSIKHIDEYKFNPLSCNLILWNHNINDENWDLASYKVIAIYKTVEDYWIYSNELTSKIINYGMFFLMRDGIFPNWEDPDNSEGCCISFKIPGNTTKEEFFKIILQCITEDILIEADNWEELNGFSIAPKKEFNIAKLWMRNKQSKYTDLMKEVPPCLLEKDCMIKDNVVEK